MYTHIYVYTLKDFAINFSDVVYFQSKVSVTHKYTEKYFYNNYLKILPKHSQIQF